MDQIDFLPPQYHQQNAKRQVKPWRIVVVTAFMLLLAAAALAQYCQRSRAEGDLKTVQPCYDETVRLGDSLRTEQAQLETAQSNAELFTYLRHPWPRTQLLSALVAPLPPQIALEQILVGLETPAEESPANPASGRSPVPRNGQKPEEGKLKNAPPALRDLERLRDQCDTAQTLFRVTGTTTDAGVLYRYLHALGAPDLFAKATLRSIESVDAPGAATLRFQLVVVVRPGYDQPGGPEGKHAP
jgi:hypothetical protein